MQVPYTAMRMSSYGDPVSLQGPNINLRASRGSLVPSKRFQKCSNRSHSPPNSNPSCPVSSTPTGPPTSPTVIRNSPTPNPHPTQSQFPSDSNPLDIERARIESNQSLQESNLQDKVVIVTGGGRGLGLTLAEALFQGGANVHCLDTLEKPHQDFIAVQSRTDVHLGGTLHYHHIELDDTQALQQLIADIAAKYELINGLIAAAGLQPVSEDIKDVADANPTAAFMTAQEVGKQMLRYDTPGSIVLVAADINQLTKNLAMQWGNKGIRVNSLCPSTPSPSLPHSSLSNNTSMAAQNVEDEPQIRAQREKEIMLGRTATPEAFRGPATFLISNASSYVTGASLVIDGGHTA